MAKANCKSNASCKPAGKAVAEGGAGMTLPKNATRYIAYYRVSTERQGRSGLGLDAQRQAVAMFLNGGAELTAEFTEVESGKAQRPSIAIAGNKRRSRAKR